MPPGFSVVVPTVGRPSLTAALRGICAGPGPRPEAVIVVDDRRAPVAPLPVPPEAAELVRVLPGRGAGPAAARNLGWRAARGDWVAFLDDDVAPAPGWRADLAGDLAGAGADVAGVQGRLHVPLPAHRRPTDWERGTAGLERAAWATADMAYRRSVLADVAGFDERFPRAFREDADLALRVLRAGHRLVVGRRRCTHPVRPADRWVSLRAQVGNADDALMRRLHGRGWHEAAAAPRGRRRRHLAASAALLAAAGCAAARRPRAAGFAALAWAGLTAEFAAARIAPGPRTAPEVTTMLATSIAIPPAATWHRAAGWWRARGAGPWPGPPRLVLFDRDGTLIEDVPGRDPRAGVAPRPGARAALERLRRHGVRVGVVTNQPGVAERDLAAVRDRVDALLGPFDVWAVCPHPPDAGCACRKPAPGLVRGALDRLAVPPERAALVGDIGSDVAAARAAGLRSVLVPTDVTRPAEVAHAPAVAPDLPAAVAILLGGAR